MTRSLLVAVVAIVVAAVVLVVSRDDGGSAGTCDGVRRAADVVAGVEQGETVPTSESYVTVAQEVRRAAVDAPSGVSPDLHALADAYGQLAILLQGFDPDDPTSFDVVEQRAPEVEREEARVDEAATRVATWLSDTCPA